MQTNLLTKDLGEIINQEVLKKWGKGQNGGLATAAPTWVLSFKQVTPADTELILSLSAEADKVRETSEAREISGIFLQC